MTARGGDRGGGRETLARAAEESQREKEDRIHQDADQMAADLDETQADSDQSSSDADGLASEVDQALADREQQASDRDQAAADRELSHSHGAVLAEAFEASRAERVEASRERESTAAARLETTAQRLATSIGRDDVALVRDLTASARDRTAQARDEAASARDRAAEARERRAVEAGDLDDAVVTLRTLRVSGASIREQSALERNAAAADREVAAVDRQHAAADRSYAGLDELAVVFRRGTDELALAHEIDRVRQARRSLVIAVIGIDVGEPADAAGALLRDAPPAIAATRHPYDVIVRSDNQFVYALSDVTLEAASDRIGEIKIALEAHRPGASISAGLAELRDDDTLESLIARADNDLHRVKPHPRQLTLELRGGKE